MRPPFDYAISGSSLNPFHATVHARSGWFDPSAAPHNAAQPVSASRLHHAVQRWQGRCGYPTLHLDDVSGIPFLVGASGVEEYQHHARLRSSDGDLFMTVTALARGYERYCRGRLGLGTPTYLLATPTANPLAVAAGAGNGDVLTRSVDTARAAGGLEDVWDLPVRIIAAADEPVTVLAPPPPVTWIANDKALFAELVELTLGPG